MFVSTTTPTRRWVHANLLNSSTASPAAAASSVGLVRPRRP